MTNGCKHSNRMIEKKSNENKLELSYLFNDEVSQDMSIALNLAAPTAFRLDDENRSTAGTRWPEWCSELEMFLVASGVKDGAQKKAVLLFVAGSEVRRIYSTLDPKDADDYDEVIKKLKAHFTPLKNLDYETFTFSQMSQRDGESLDEFVVRLRVAAVRCEFTATDAEIKRQIIRGCISTKLRQHILETPGIGLDKIVEKARAAEAAATQTKVIERAGKKEHVKSEPIAAISSRGPTKYQQGKNDQKTASTRNRNQAASQGNKRLDSTKKCFACGYEYPHKDECPAQKSKCRKCNAVGHFAKSRLCTKNRVNFIDQEDEERENTSS